CARWGYYGHYFDYW
nr:immunoglobulin heavy chain junction region [Mus musculus]